MGLVHEPKLIFLDEPTTGLDPQARANLWTHIQALREERGTTVFLTTHYLDEADELAERVMVMDHGRVIADDTAPALKQQLAGDRVTLKVERLGELSLHQIDLTAGAVLETGCVYIVPLLEELRLPGHLAAAANPKSSTGRLDIFTRVIADQARASGKPDNIIEKMVEGRLRKFYEEVVLLKQSFVINPDVTVEQALKDAEKEIGAPAKVAGFVRFALGEGIEKEESDFAAEVAAAAKK
jgi:energy-coupling factor transporter ATP-binding protein EcfA2